MKIRVIQLMPPNENGFYDHIDVVGGGEIFYRGPCRAAPNPYHPKTFAAWHTVYSWIAPATLTFKCDTSKKHGKCLRLYGTDGSDRVPTRNQNVNQDGKTYARAVLIHRAYSETWSGSMACITISPSRWKRFIDLFKMGDCGDVEIIDLVAA